MTQIVDIPGFPGWSIEGGGRVWRVVAPSGRPVSLRFKGDREYCHVGDSYMQVGRAVLMATAGPPPFARAECCHDDGDPMNNDPRNLYWGTRGQNASDAVRHGTHHTVGRLGLNHPRGKLSGEQIEEIRARYRPRTGQLLADEYGITRSHVSRIVRAERRNV